MSFVKVASKDEIENGRGKVANIKGREVALLNDNGKLFAIENACKHVGGPLGEGSCGNGKVTCPWHSWTYDLKTGENTFDENIKLEIYEVKIKDEDVLVNIEAKGG